jgi:hypothetical protein
LQELLMRVGVIPHVLPLLFAYDATAEVDDGEQGGGTAAAEAAATAGEGATAAAEERGPKFLGLGIVRSNMQVRHPCGTDCMSTACYSPRTKPHWLPFGPGCPKLGICLPT